MERKRRIFPVLCYITWIGWGVAFFLRDPEDSLLRRHLNQALLLNLASLVFSALIRRGGLLGVVGTVGDVLCAFWAFMGILRALKMSEEPLPLLGGIEWIK